jgi:hypothetical protein
MLQKCVEIGANYGNIDINDLLCGRTKFTEVILKNQFDECISEVKNDLKNSYGIGLTMDFWEEQHRKITYISLTIHYIDSECHLKSRIISSDEFDFEKKLLPILKYGLIRN